MTVKPVAESSFKLIIWFDILAQIWSMIGQKTLGPYDFHDAENVDEIMEVDNKNGISCNT